jgi:hypothetical protein
MPWDENGHGMDPESDELGRLVRSLVAVILEDDAMPPWSTVSDRYWRTVAAHAMANEPDLVADIKALAEKIRTRFRTCAEHMHHIHMVACTKSPRAENDLHVCCVCLRAVQCTWRRTVRLKAHDGDPAKCGHVLHESCASRLRPNEDDGCVHCPMCREVIGPSLQYWIDTESTVPRF